jgi:alpha-glucosidase
MPPILIECKDIKKIRYLEEEPPSQEPEDFKFIKVEDFFKDYQTWDHISHIEPPGRDAFDCHQNMLTFTAVSTTGQKSVIAIQVPRKDIFRFRFNPCNTYKDQYTRYNTQTVQMDTFTDLIGRLAEETNHLGEKGKFEPLYISPDQLENKRFELLTKKDGRTYMKISIQLDPYQLSVYRFKKDNNVPYLVHSDATPSLYFQKHFYGSEKDVEYSIIQCKNKPITAKYVGFGEMAGDSLCKNSTQLNYFNFDNFKYSKVYDKGPLETREPLYHSNPFFLEFYGIPFEKTCMQSSQKPPVYGIFVDNCSQVCMDIGYLNPNRYLIGTRFNDLDYYFFLGDTCSDIIEAYTAIVGRANLPPRYALGYHQGCFGYKDGEKLKEVARKYRSAKIPIDGLHIDVDIQKDYRTFTIDESKDKFPQPKEMFKELRDSGFKCSTNITPIISDEGLDRKNYLTYRSGIEKGYFVMDKRCRKLSPVYQNYPKDQKYDPKDKKENPYVGQVYYGDERGTTGHYPDFGREEVQKWWGEQYQDLFETGLEMVWQDMTTPCIPSDKDSTKFSEMRGDMDTFPFNLMIADNWIKGPKGAENSEINSPFIKILNLYSYNLHKATYDGLNSLDIRCNKRNFIIGRGCYSGMHKYAALWTGDNASTWDFMKITLHQVLALGLSGQPISGSDVGGFERDHDKDKWVDPELLIRWTTMGAFLPWFRNHYNGNHKYFQELYAYDKEFYDEDCANDQKILNLLNEVSMEQQEMYHYVLPVCRHYIKLRYQLIQLFYDALFENIHTGRPICRPLFVTDECDEALFHDKLNFLNNEFLVGDDLLVAPVLDKQSQANGNGKRDIYLPTCSRWYEFKNNKLELSSAIEGGTTIFDQDAGIDEKINKKPNRINHIVPLYVREGAVIPTLKLEQYIGELVEHGRPNIITLNIYPAKHDNFRTFEYNMYLDDGVSRSSAPKNTSDDTLANYEFCHIKITHCYTALNSRLIKIDKKHDQFLEKEKHFGDFFFVAILHDPEEYQKNKKALRMVSIGETNLQPISVGSLDELETSPQKNAWYYDENVQISFIKVFDTSTVGNPIEIKLEYYLRTFEINRLILEYENNNAGQPQT